MITRINIQSPGPPRLLFDFPHRQFLPLSSLYARSSSGKLTPQAFSWQLLSYRQELNRHILRSFSLTSDTGAVAPHCFTWLSLHGWLRDQGSCLSLFTAFVTVQERCLFYSPCTMDSPVPKMIIISNRNWIYTENTIKHLLNIHLNQTRLYHKMLFISFSLHNNPKLGAVKSPIWKWRNEILKS